MTKLAAVSSRQCIRALKKAEFQIARTSGDHVILKHPQKPNIVSVPNRQCIRSGLLRKIIRDAGLSPQEFESLRLG